MMEDPDSKHGVDTKPLLGVLAFGMVEGKLPTTPPYRAGLGTGSLAELIAEQGPR